MRDSPAALVLAIGLMASTLAAQQADLIDRTVAIVGGQVITLSDARAAVTLGLVDVRDAVDREQTATARLVDRELILREVRRYSPPAPSDATIDARLLDVRARFSDPAALSNALEMLGLTEARLRAWVRDDLRAQAYLDQRFAAASVPTDVEISRAYAQQREAFDRTGTAFDEAATLVRAELAASRRRMLIADWVSDLRRRTDVILLP